MKRPSILIFLFLMFIILAGDGNAQKKGLPENYKKWLEEEVIYIIGSKEKEVFLQLQTDRERDLFIEAFWNHRDPTPGTPENEFKTEHYRRINYANHFFGRKSPLPGWKTDRGRVYIKLGEPNDIERYEAQSATYPVEVWFYQGQERLGLPIGFNIVFFQKGGSGDFVLYSPAQHGPQALLPSYYGDPLDYLDAYTQLRDASPDVARYSLSLLPDEQMMTLSRPTLASDLLIQKVESSPQYMLEERYAQKFLAYKDIVEVEYSTNYIESDSLVKVFKEPSGTYFVHYALEPSRISVGAYEQKYYTLLKVNGKISDMEGKTIFQFERDYSLDFNEDQITAISHQALDLHDMFPLIPGTYNFSIILKNEVSKEFTSLEKKLFIPGDETPLQMTSLLLGFKTTKVEAGVKRLQPFQLGTTQIYSQPNRVFTKADHLAVGFQIYGLSAAVASDAELKFVFLRDETEFRSFSKKVSQFPEAPNFVEEIPLTEFPPAHYKLRLSLLVAGKEALSTTEEFDVSLLETVPRPFIRSKIHAAAEDPVYEYIIGLQLLNSGKVNEARVKLEEAYTHRPESIDFALSLAHIYLTMAEFKKVEPILLPFLKQTQKPKYELFMILGKAHQGGGELEKAISIYDQTISHYGINTNILNALGDCYFQLGRTGEALVSWKKSLELNPDQPQVKKYVETLEGKK
ncbi:MAG: GWxTD domain-containing protein [Candidatus Aminicenantales bacterium]